jgi:hypothetical protein
MEPKDPNKKFDDLFKNMNFSFTVPINAFPSIRKETTEQMIARLNEVDETIDAMTDYPQAKKMLDKLYGKL